MYKTVRQGDSCLQYRILPQEDGTGLTTTRTSKSRSRRSRITCILISGLVIGCFTVAGAVVLPILLTTNIVALPAGFQTFTLKQHSNSKYNHLQGTQYIAIVPVREAHLRLIPAWGSQPNGSSPGISSVPWSDLTLWKTYGSWRVVVPVVSLTLLLLGALIYLVRRQSLLSARRSSDSTKRGRGRKTLLEDVSEED